MAAHEYDDPDSEDSENLGTRHGGRRRSRQYAPNITLKLPAPISNGNFKWVAMVLVGILISISAYLWTTKDRHDETKDDRISKLEGWKERVDERLDWMQKEIEQNRK